MAIKRIPFDDDEVYCDWCGDNKSDSEETGGILFGTKACCPACVPRVEELAAQYGEEKYIRERVSDEIKFTDWVKQLRGPNPELVIYSGKDAERKILKGRSKP